MEPFSFKEDMQKDLTQGGIKGPQEYAISEGK